MGAGGNRQAVKLYFKRSQTDRAASKGPCGEIKHIPLLGIWHQLQAAKRYPGTEINKQEKSRLILDFLSVLISLNICREH